jgi:hypothetical protein
MKKIMMTKYGFVRWSEEDFSDDGNRFYCFRVGKCVRVSKLVSGGQVYISARIDGIKLPYEIYSNLPHYRALDALNGVPLETLTDADLEKLYADCLAYEQEYLEAEKTTKYPTVNEIIVQCKKIHTKALTEFEVAGDLFRDFGIEAALALSDYEWRQLKDYLTRLSEQASTFDSNEKIEKYAQDAHGTSFSFNFCAPTYSGLKDSYYYISFIEIINKVR